MSADVSVVNIDIETQIGADGQRHPIGEAPDDPAPYRRVPVDKANVALGVYAPANPSDWGAEPPGTVAEALDMLAVLLTP